MVRHGKFLYGVDGSGPLFRTDLTTGETYTGLDAPTTAPTVQPSPLVIEDCDTAGDWISQPSPTSLANLLLNYSFETGTIVADIVEDMDNWTEEGNTDAKSFTSSGDAMDPQDGNYALLLDEPGNAVTQSVTAAALSALANAPPNLPAKARVYQVAASYHQADTSGQATADVSVSALNGSTVMAAPSIELSSFVHADAPDWSTEQFIFSFGSLSVDPTNLSMRLAAGSDNQPGDDTGFFIDFVYLRPMDHKLTIDDAGENRLLLSVYSKDLAAVTQPAALRYTAGLWIRKDYGAGDLQSFADVANIGIPISFPSAVAQASRPRFRVGFQKDSATDVVFSNPGMYSADGGKLVIDITTISLADRENIRYLYLQILDDLPEAAADGAVCTIGPIQSLGALSVGYAYNWFFSEYRQVGEGSPDVGDFENIDNIQSSGSPLSVQMVAGPDGARFLVTMPPAVNAEATHFLIWRQGGVLSGTDGPIDFGRIIGVVPVDADAAGWTFADRVFVDNVSDAALLTVGRRVVQVGRDQFPDGGTDLAVWANRLWMAHGNQIYGSWLLDPDAESGIYTTLENLETDPYLRTKGVRLGLTGADRDAITRLQPFGTILIAWRSHSVSVVSGYDPTNFAVQNYLSSPGLGCSATRCAGVVLVEALGINEVWYLSPVGLMQFNGDTAIPKSAALDGVLKQDLLNPGAYARCSMVFHDSRVWIFAPETSADQVNAIAYVWDPNYAGTKDAGWARIRAARFTGAVAVTGAGDDGRLYLAGEDGQLYRYEGNIDRHTPSGSAQGIVVLFEGRGMGPDGSVGLGVDGVPRELWTRLYYAGGYMTGTGHAIVHVYVEGDRPAELWHGALYVTSGEKNIRKRTGHKARGMAPEVRIAARVEQPLILRAFGLDEAAGTRAERR
jgi:hypothetical protein